MAVYTEVPRAAAAALIARLDLGTLQSLEPCAGGIENTNYFCDTDAGRYVLTLFERLGAAELPYYLHLMRHLAERGLPVPAPQTDAAGAILHTVCGKPLTESLFVDSRAFKSATGWIPPFSLSAGFARALVPLQVSSFTEP